MNVLGYENSALSQFEASFLSFQGTPDISSGISKNVLNRTMKLSSSFVQSRGTSESRSMPVRVVKYWVY